MSSATVQSHSVDNGRSCALYILAVACFPLLIAGVLTLLVFTSGGVERDDGIRHQSEFAQFDFPQPGDLVSDRFVLRGSVKKIPAGKTIFLAELSDGRYWPKKQLGEQPGSFKREQKTSPGDGYKYSVVLLAVGDAGASQIEQWLAHGRSTGDYPGLKSIAESTPLAKIRIIRQ